MAVIYRIRNKITGKCYIGETTEKDPYTRWKDHLNTIRKGKGCPALRDAVEKYGEEAFEFQILIFCFDEDRFTYEIEYIAKYNTQVPNGYNIAKGGQGGGAFVGKKHKPETIAKIQEKMRVYYDDPEWIRKHSERARNQFAKPEKRKAHSEIMKNSEKFKKAVEEGRVGGGVRDYTPEICKKISDSLKAYFEKNGPNVEKHRKVMAKAVGKKVYQYYPNGCFIRAYDSIRDACRIVEIHKNSIQQVLDKPTRKAAGFIWKTTGPNTIEHT